MDRVLKAIYYPSSDILLAGLGTKPSYTWRSLYGVKGVIEKGSRWIVGDSNSLNVWTTRWLLRFVSFRANKGAQDLDPEMLVANFIDKETGC